MPVGISYRAMLAAAGSSAAADAYIVNSFAPPVVADFAGVLNSGTEYYRVGGSDSTFDSMFTYAGASLKTMTDSDGLLKWAPHNRLVRSQEFDNASWAKLSAANVTANATTAPDGTTTADLFYATGSDNYIELEQTHAIGTSVTTDSYISFQFSTETFVNSVGSVGATSFESLADGWYLLTVARDKWTFAVFAKDNGSNGITIRHKDGQKAALMVWETQYTSSEAADGCYIWGAHYYRSDLGGMVDNPDRGDSYVPTTTAAVYQARRNHYRYNGTSFVNKGILLESEARTNLITNSNAITSEWVNIRCNEVQDDTGPDGLTSAWTITDDNSGGSNSSFIYKDITVSTSTTYTFSIFAKADQLSWLRITFTGFTTPATSSAWFNLSTAAKGVVEAGFDAATIEDIGSGWCRVSVTYTTDASDTIGRINLALADADNDTLVDLDSTSSIILYGAQNEIGATPSSYIPTSGATVTRAAETLQIDGGDWAANQTAISWHIQGEIDVNDDNDGFADVIFEAYANSTNFIQLRASTSTDDWLGRHLTSVGTGDDASVNFGSISYGINQPINLAVRLVNAGQMNGADAGTSGTADTHTGTIAAAYASTVPLTLYKGTVSDAARVAQGTVALLRNWAVDIGDTGIESATS